jgi:hypothetical protein
VEVSNVNHVTNETRTGTSAAPRRLSRLFKVVVVGGAVLAAAYASTLTGGTGAADRGEEDGGPKGW